MKTEKIETFSSFINREAKKVEVGDNETWRYRSLGCNSKEEYLENLNKLKETYEERVISFQKSL